MNAYYNEIDTYAVQWLKNLIAEGLIAPGDVDDRPIQEVKPDDLKGYTQCHFFAGIAGWSLALRLAGWPDDRPVWTGSCPCQPFSGAGRRKGAADERHLWPAFFRLIAECQPSTVFGEQVAGKLGLEWLAAIRLDLEDVGYACGATDLPVASIGAPHKRNRLYWVADSSWGNSTRGKESRNYLAEHGEEKRSDGESRRSSPSDRPRPLGDSRESGLEGRTPNSGILRGKDKEERNQARATSSDDSSDLGLGHSDGTEGERLGQYNFPVEPEQETERPGDDSPWEGVVFVRCADGKARPVKPGIFPLAHGVPGRVGQLRAYGNAIVPQVGAEFIKAFMEI